MDPYNKKNTPFQKHEVEDYERKRYRGLDQKIVDAREHSILNRFLNTINKKNLKVLDVPCGYGRFSAILSGFCDYLVNSDISYHMVERAGERKTSLPPGFVAGAVADTKQGIPFQPNSFELVFSMRFFHHVHSSEERKNILSEFYRVSENWLILSFYRSNFLHFIQRKLRRKVKKSSTRISMISFQEFKSEIQDAGFRIVKISPLIRGLHAQHIVFMKKDQN